jgi:CRISPR-associated protein Cmr4
MKMKAKMYWLHALSPLHVGSGTGVGFIDLPVAREKVTGWPLAPGSGVKGVVATHHGAATEDSRKRRSDLRAAFGVSDPEKNETTGNSGALVFCDARLACLPVRSLFGTFAWVASPMGLGRLLRDLKAAHVAVDLTPHATVDSGCVQLPAGASAVTDSGKDSGKVYLGDLDFTASPGEATKRWAQRIGEWAFPGDAVWQSEFLLRFAVVPDNTFDLLCQTATEVTPRIKMDPDKKMVDTDHGALWYEEYLPAESLLAGLVWCDRVFHEPGVNQAEDLLARFCGGELTLQMGGKATVGKGLVRCVFGA